VLDRALAQSPRPDGERDYLVMLGRNAPAVRDDNDLCRKLSDCHQRWRKHLARKDELTAPPPPRDSAAGGVGAPRATTEGDFAPANTNRSETESFPPPRASVEGGGSLRSGETEGASAATRRRPKREQPDNPMENLPYEERERAERQLAEMENRKPSPLSNTAAPFEWQDPAQMHRRIFMHNRHAAMGFVSGTVAPGGVGKTALVLAECLGLATGTDIFKVGAKGRANVWYIGLEDPIDEYRRRIAACALLHKLDTRAIEESFFLNVGAGSNNFVMTERTQAGTDVCRPAVDALMHSIIQRDISLVVVDPFVASHRAAESDNMTIATLVRAWSQIAAQTGAAVELVHHTRKGAGNEPSVDDARGASALVNALRAVRMLVPMSEDEAAAAEVYSPERFFRVVSVKANLTTRVRPPEWREIVPVPLGNPRFEGDTGDLIGAVQRWDPPSPASEDQLAQIKEALASGEYRLDVRAENWAGKPIAEILGLDLRDADQRAKVRRMIRTWIAEGTLKVRERVDDHRLSKRYIVVCEETADS